MFGRNLTGQARLKTHFLFVAASSRGDSLGFMYAGDMCRHIKCCFLCDTFNETLNFTILVCSIKINLKKLFLVLHIIEMTCFYR